MAKTQILMFTMAYSGSWNVTEDTVENNFVTLQACVEHLANTQHFALRNLGVLQEGSMLVVLAKRD